MTLSGRKVLITGANRGLGASFVEAALARQASAVYAAARDPALLPRFSDPARVVPVRLDVTDQQEVTEAGLERTDVDLLISNAGVTCHGPVLGGDDEAIVREVLEVNFFGPLRLVRSFGPGLRAPRRPAAERPNLGSRNTAAQSSWRLSTNTRSVGCQTGRDARNHA